MSLVKRDVRWIPASPPTGAGGTQVSKPLSARARWRHIVQQIHQFPMIQWERAEGSDETLDDGMPPIVAKVWVSNPTLANSSKARGGE